MNDVELEEVNIVLYLVLSVFTFGLFYLYWQFKQMRMGNILAGNNDHSFLAWFFLSLFTFGLYHMYHEYKFSQTIIELQELYGVKIQSSEYPLLCLLISIVGLFAVVDIIHQDDLNKIIRHKKQQLI